MELLNKERYIKRRVILVFLSKKKKDCVFFFFQKLSSSLLQDSFRIFQTDACLTWSGMFYEQNFLFNNSRKPNTGNAYRKA